MRFFIIQLFALILSSCALFHDQHSKTSESQLLNTVAIDFFYQSVVVDSEGNVVKEMVISDIDESEKNRSVLQVIREGFQRSLPNTKLIFHSSLNDLGPQGVWLKVYHIKKKNLDKGLNYLWAGSSALTLGLIPYWKDNLIKIDVLDSKGSHIKSINRSYVYAFSLFLLPVMPFYLPRVELKKIEAEVVTEILTAIGKTSSDAK